MVALATYLGTVISMNTEARNDDNAFPVTITPINCEWYDSGSSHCPGCCEVGHSSSQPPALLQEAAAQRSDWTGLLTDMCEEELPGGPSQDGDNNQRFRFLGEKSGSS